MRKHGQKGVTLVELLVASAIAGLVVPAAMAGIYQISRGTTTINTDFIIQQDIDNAASWFTRDLGLGQTTNLVDLAAPVSSMRMDWLDETGWATEGSEAHYAVYSLSGTNLLRTYDGTTSIVARNVEGISFSRSGDFITVSITSTFEGESESLSYFVTPRSDAPLTTQ